MLPVTSTLQTGWSYHIVNNSTGNITIQSSGLNTVITVIPGTTAMVTCIGTALTTAADWESGITDFSTYTGTGAVVLGTSPTLTTPNIGAATGTSVNLTGNANVGNLGTGGLIVATGNVTGGNLTTGGQLTVTGIGTIGGVVLPTWNLGGTDISTVGGGSAATGRTLLGWNRSSGGGEFSIITNRDGGGTGGVKFYEWANTLSNTTTEIFSVTATGAVTTPSTIVATGNVTGGNLVTGGILSVTGTGVSSIAGNLDMTSNTIINLATPTNSTDAATKQYVDDVAQGLNIHDSCNAATQTTLATISGGTITYNNGTAGVGATLTTTGSYTTIDGVTLADGMRILVKNEATAANNGIYVRTSATVLTRAADFNTPAEMEGGDFTFITAGTLYDNTGWVMTDPVTTVGTSPVIWVQFSGAGTYTAGTGLTLTGSQFSITNTTVTAGAYGNGDYNATFTVNGQGQLTAAANVAITANAANLTGTSLNSSIVTSSLTSVGTLGSLTVTGNVTGGNLVTAGKVYASEMINGGTGIYLSAGPAGYINFFTTGGDKATISDTGNIAASNLIANSTVFAVAANISGNVNAGNVSATTFTGALSGAATTAGTVTTNAQPNITSVGTLTSLAVTGNATSGNFIGRLANGNSNVNIAAANGNVTIAAVGNTT